MKSLPIFQALNQRLIRMKFKKLFVLLTLTLEGISFSGSAGAGMPIQHWSLKSGAKVYLITTPNLPMLDLQIDFDAGSRRDPVEQPGVSSAVAMMMSKGVLASANKPALDENQLGEAWADLGASFMASASQDRFSFRLRALTQDDILGAAIDLVAQQMARPSFDSKIFMRERDKALSGLKESLTQPGVVAGRAFSKVLYPDHPYGALTTPESLVNTNISDLQTFYRTTSTLAQQGLVWLAMYRVKRLLKLQIRSCNSLSVKVVAPLCLQCQALSPLLNPVSSALLLTLLRLMC